MAIGRDLRNLAIRHSLLSPADRVLFAVSGGPDSVALLHLLCELREEFKLSSLEVAHLQHGIRGEEAKEDAEFVAAITEKLELPFHLKEIDLPRMKSDAGKGNVEALGRAERYRFFAEVVKDRGDRDDVVFARCRKEGIRWHVAAATTSPGQWLAGCADRHSPAA